MKEKHKNNYLIFFSGLIGILAAYVLFSYFTNYFREDERSIIKKEETIDLPGSGKKNNDTTAENSSPEYLKAKITISETPVEVEIPLNSEASRKGLGGRSEIKEGEGMLFLFSENKKHSFSMRGMNFDLDFIFIRDDEVADIKKNVDKDYDGNIIGQTDYNQVLEIGAGQADANGFSIGDRAVIVYR